MNTHALIVAADVGGTNTKMALGLAEAPGSPPLVQHVFRSGEHPSLEAVLARFLRMDEVVARGGPIAAACFAVAGPVEGGRGRLTNLPWRPDEREIAARFRIPAVRVINDFAAAGHGIDHLRPDDLLTLQAGTPLENAERVVVGAGTGLGVALLEWDDPVYEVHASEAGHTDFAPVDPLQDLLLQHLRREFGRVSYERVLSGSGLVRVLRFVEDSGYAQPSAALREAMAEGDPARAVSEAALAGSDEAAVRAMDIFVSAYGSFAGNMALVTLAQGGTYIAGGIAPKIAPKLVDGTFMQAFTAKGRFEPLLRSIPVHVVVNERVGLIGALAEAAHLARSGGGPAA